MEPAVAELKRDGFRIQRIDVGSHTGTAKEYGVRSIPTFVYVVDGNEIRRAKGAMSSNSLRELWRRSLL